MFYYVSIRTTYLLNVKLFCDLCLRKVPYLNLLKCLSVSTKSVLIKDSDIKKGKTTEWR